MLHYAVSSCCKLVAKPDWNAVLLSNKIWTGDFGSRKMLSRTVTATAASSVLILHQAVYQLEHNQWPTNINFFHSVRCRSLYAPSKLSYIEVATVPPHWRWINTVATHAFLNNTLYLAARDCCIHLPNWMQSAFNSKMVLLMLPLRWDSGCCTKLRFCPLQLLQPRSRHSSENVSFVSSWCLTTTVKPYASTK